MSRKVVEIAGRRLSLSNLEKDLYPSYGFTKAHVLEYYSRIAEFILPHLKDRALTLKRYPEGVEKDFFFEKRCPSHHPAWVKTASIRRDDSEWITVCLVNDLETLLWVENLASLELHVPLARAGNVRFHGLRSGPRRSGKHPGLCPGCADPSGPALPVATGVLCKDLGPKRTPCVRPLELHRDDL